MTKTEIYTRLADLQEGALGLLTEKLRSFNRHCIDSELARPEGDEDYSYVASCAIDLNYLEIINNEISVILNEVD